MKCVRMLHRLTYLRAGVVCAALLLICGCAIHRDHAVALRQSYHQGDLQSALKQTDPAEKRKFDDDVTRLNRAMVQLTSGSPAEAEQLLRETRDRFDYLAQRSLAEEAKSLMTDDRRLAYSGEEYENILIRVMLAISDLMQDADDVHAYALQVSERQQQLLQAAQPASEETAPQATNAELAELTSQLAIGSYLRAAILESSPLDYDDVQRCRVQVANWQPAFRDAKIDLARAESGRHSEAGNGVVYVLAMVGEGPLKEEQSAVATTASLLIADRILSAIGKYELPPNVAPVKIPVVVRAPQTVEAIDVSMDGHSLGSTATIMDVSRLAVEQNKLARDDTIARAVARRIAKKGAIYAAKDGLNVERSPELDLLLTVAGVAWEATERADTRCWSLLPDRIQVLRVELPAGPQKLTLSAKGFSGGLSSGQSVAVDVRDGKSTFVLANFPKRQAVGPIQVSQPR